jgi:vacuolar-type H+-ATPase subunit E/Vma4
VGGAAFVNLISLREALLDTTRGEAREQEQRDETAAQARLEAARKQAAASVEHGRLEGEQAAAREAARVRAAADRHAREARLRAQRALIDELRSRARDAALKLPGQPGYERLLERLGETARLQLGSDAELERDPAGAGGLVGRAGRRSVDYTLPALVDRIIAGLGEELDGLRR